MKMNKTLAAMLLAMGALTMGTAQAASGGNVTFSGEINDASCSIDPDSTDLNVPMGSITSKVLAGGKESEPVVFKINLRDCENSVGSVKVGFGGAPNSVDETLLALGGGNATGAGIKLMNENGGQIELGSQSGNIPLVPGSNTLQFQASLKGTGGAVTPGQFSSTANFTLIYN